MKSQIGKIEPVTVVQQVSDVKNATRQYEEKFKQMNDQQMNHYSLLCDQAGLSEPEKLAMLSYLTKQETEEISKRLGVDTSTEIGKQIYYTFVNSANSKIVSRFGNVLK